MLRRKISHIFRTAKPIPTSNFGIRMDYVFRNGNSFISEVKNICYDINVEHLYVEICCILT